MRLQFLALAGFLISTSCSAQQPTTSAGPARNFNTSTLLYEGEEKHLGNVRQLTYGGDNAEAYFSFDSKEFTFQSNNKAWGLNCDQIFRFELSKGNMKDS